jgi:hypothetical protein
MTRRREPAVVKERARISKRRRSTVMLHVRNRDG